MKRYFIPFALLLIATSAHGQLLRSTTNPYSQTAGSGFSGGANNGYNRNPTIVGQNPLGLLNGQVFPSVSKNSPYGGGLKMNINTRPQTGGYTTGSAGSYYTYKAPVNPTPIGGNAGFGPRSAFDRWATEKTAPANPVPAEDIVRQWANASPKEVSSGEALNALLKSLAPLADKLKTTPAVPIDEAFLKRLSFSRGSGSVGLLRAEGKIEWPAQLVELPPKEEVAKIRAQIDQRFQDAFTQVAGGATADPDNLKALRKLIDMLSETATARAQAMTFAENVRIKQHLRSLEDSVTFLKQDDAGNWLPGRPAFKPESVQDMIALMQEKNVHFAPAFTGNESAYTTLYRSMVAIYTEAAQKK